MALERCCVKFSRPTPYDAQVQPQPSGCGLGTVSSCTCRKAVAVAATAFELWLRYSFRAVLATAFALWLPQPRTLGCDTVFEQYVPLPLGLWVLGLCLAQLSSGCACHSLPQPSGCGFGLWLPGLRAVGLAESSGCTCHHSLQYLPCGCHSLWLWLPQFFGCGFGTVFGGLWLWYSPWGCGFGTIFGLCHSRRAVAVTVALCPATASELWLPQPSGCFGAASPASPAAMIMMMIRIPSISSNNDDRHDYASLACQTGTNGTLEV